MEVSSRNRLGGESDDSGAGFLFSESPDWVVFQLGRRSVVFLRSAVGVTFRALHEVSAEVPTNVLFGRGLERYIGSSEASSKHSPVAVWQRVTL